MNKPDKGTTTKVTAMTLLGMKGRERVSMVTAYDATFARLAEEAGVDALLVGDSLGMVIQGHENTLSVTLEDMIYHTKAVRRGSARAHVVGDMPFMSYQPSPEVALTNAGRLVKEGGAEAVKLEGGVEYEDAIGRIVRAGIPVMGHVGLTPQSVHAMGGFKVQGRSPEAARRVLDDAKAVEAAGAYAIVLEGVPVELSRVITAHLSIPTIGIGAGAACDGQVLVMYDLLGMSGAFRPRFVKAYADLGREVVDALGAYAREVKDGSFPADEHTFHAKVALFGPRGSDSDATSNSALDRDRDRDRDRQEHRGGRGHHDDDDPTPLYGVPV
ncbi:MAG: 3-methyl-2-oxobutanoate hydroxymethyltransferase [Deltaproteobacteria bacterium]|nr:3-methyl-2-oxobutanoate hydroxymethyltransferase [Deltaproteobacteria bacterium]